MFCLFFILQTQYVRQYDSLLLLPTRTERDLKQNYLYAQPNTTCPESQTKLSGEPKPELCGKPKTGYAGPKTKQIYARPKTYKIHYAEPQTKLHIWQT